MYRSPPQSGPTSVVVAAARTSCGGTGGYGRIPLPWQMVLGPVLFLHPTVGAAAYLGVVGKTVVAAAAGRGGIGRAVVSAGRGRVRWRRWLQIIRGEGRGVSAAGEGGRLVPGGRCTSEW